METWLGTALWRQFGAAIDMLEDAVATCPASLWTRRLWPVPARSDFPTQFGEFWYVAFHALVWLDLYLAGVPEEEFAPPPPFPRGELDSMATLPARPYTKEALRAYLACLRQKCQTVLVALPDEHARQPITAYPWIAGQSISFLELQLYSLRHVQEHSAQLSLFLGQHPVPDTDHRWVPREG